MKNHYVDESHFRELSHKEIMSIDSDWLQQNVWFRKENSVDFSLDLVRCILSKDIVRGNSECKDVGAVETTFLRP